MFLKYFQIKGLEPLKNSPDCDSMFATYMNRSQAFEGRKKLYAFVSVQKIGWVESAFFSGCEESHAEKSKKNICKPTTHKYRFSIEEGIFKTILKVN